MMPQMAITICRWLSQPNRSLSRIVCRGQEALKAEKALLGVISRPIIDLGFFSKANVTTRYNKTVMRLAYS
jgi:hypothetical protein